MNHLPLSSKTPLNQAVPYPRKLLTKFSAVLDLENLLPMERERETTFDIDEIIQKIENKANHIEVESDVSSEQEQ
jgi:hypothetical protein